MARRRQRQFSGLVFPSGFPLLIALPVLGFVLWKMFAPKTAEATPPPSGGMLPPEVTIYVPAVGTTVQEKARQAGF